MDTINWSDLPNEFWPIIGNLLHSRLDVIRFRSVCSLWRSSRPPFLRPPPPPLLPLKFSSAVSAEPLERKALLFTTTTYRMDSLVSGTKPWLMKLEEDPDSGKSRLIHPVTNSPLRYSPTGTSKEFSLLDFRVVELRKSYVLKFRYYGTRLTTLMSVHKLVVMPCDYSEFGNVYGVVMLYNEGKLGFVRFGDEKLTRVDEPNAHYDDMIVYKGQCYVVDKWGTISWLSSGLQVVQFSPPLCGFGKQKHLVESCGELYVVDQYCETVTYHDHRGRLRNQNQNRDQDYELIWGHHQNYRHVADATDFKVYKLDQEWGKWVDVKDLGDRIFILSNDGSFSVSSREFTGVKGNCILFYERLSARCHSRVFNVENGRISHLSSLLSSSFVQPPLTWLGSD